jgi:hypothetical protein
MLEKSVWWESQWFIQIDGWIEGYEWQLLFTTALQRHLRTLSNLQTRNKCILKPECESLHRPFSKANYTCTNTQQSHIKDPTNRS